jgi:hypothetical protein
MVDPQAFVMLVLVLAAATTLVAMTRSRTPIITKEFALFIIIIQRLKTGGVS